MPSTPPPHEPGLAWALVHESRAAYAPGPLPDLGSSTTRWLQPAGSESGRYRLAPVTAWAHLAPRSRPESFCPVCHERVTLKLGRVVRHHFAHAAGSRCRAATAEGALHLEAKYRLAEQLGAGGRGLVLEPVCHRVPGDRVFERCARAPLVRLELEWDEVRVEERLPSLRADLLLLRRAEPVLALEVYASHAVDEVKGEKYRMLGVPWVEVDARRITPADGAPWSAGEPLPTLGESRSYPARWRCPRHRSLFEAWVSHQRTGVHPLAWRVVHLYRTDGGLSRGTVRAERRVIWMMERRVDGAVVEAWLERDGGTPISPPAAVRDRTHARELLHRRFLGWARWSRTERGVTVDSPMSWSPGDPPPARELTLLFPQRLRAADHRGAFVGAPGLPSRAWPAPLFARGSAHPVFGDAPVFWTDLADDGRAAALHAVVPPCWVTLRPRIWRGASARGARADLTLAHHDGRRWVEAHHAAGSVELALPDGPGEPAWEKLLLRVATHAAENLESVLGRQKKLTDVAAFEARFTGGSAASEEGRPRGP